MVELVDINTNNTEIASYSINFFHVNINKCTRYSINSNLPRGLYYWIKESYTRINWDYHVSRIVLIFAIVIQILAWLFISTTPWIYVNTSKTWIPPERFLDMKDDVFLWKPCMFGTAMIRKWIKKGINKST